MTGPVPGAPAHDRLVRWFVVVLTVVGLAGCATPRDVAADETEPYVLPTVGDDADRYGSQGVAPLRVVRGTPAELAGTVVEGGETPAGTPYYVTIGFTAGRPTLVDAVDSLGGEHPPLRVITAGGLRPCDADTPDYAHCRVYVLPSGTELVGLVLRNVS